MTGADREAAAANRAHAERMRALQAEQRAKVARAGNPDRGLVLIHTGDGKGKSTAAFGVAARALGWGKRVGVVQFIKGTWQTGERRFFDRFPDRLEWRTTGQGFTWDTQDRAADIAAARSGLAAAREMLSGGYDLVILDEINVVLSYDFLQPGEVLACLEARSARTHVILTGRGASPQLTDYADLVSEMVEIKHPFRAGIKAQRGIDF